MRLLEEKVVEIKIVEKASDNTIETPIPRKRARMKRKPGECFHKPSASSGSMRNCLGRRQRSQVAMIALTTDTAVNREIAMPSPMVTAKPRTGPEPNQNSRAVAISAVTLESTMVE